ncbi:hypothetical protein QVD99_006881 [Batrachochytrium dendrobatidis]|nr:hypothetical protein QVD99_006881 [Batrachochytrium dendrobatidis]
MAKGKGLNIPLLVSGILALIAAIMVILLLCTPVIVDFDHRDNELDYIGLISSCDEDGCRWTCYRASPRNGACNNLMLAKSFSAVSVAFILLFLIAMSAMQFSGRLPSKVLKSVGAIAIVITIIFISQSLRISIERASYSHSIQPGAGFYTAIVGLVCLLVSMGVAGSGFYGSRTKKECANVPATST